MTQTSQTSLEQRILRGAISDRSIYEAFTRSGDPKGLSAIGRHCLEIVGSYYDSDGSAGQCDEGTLLERAGRLANPKHGDAVRSFVRDLPESISAPNVLRDIREHRIGVISDNLALALANRSPEAPGLAAQYQEALHGTGAPSERGRLAPLNLLNFAQHVGAAAEKDGLIHLWPKALNDACDGGARRGHAILIFGRPESGKTLVTINLVAGFLHQKLNVLYVCNEEPDRDIMRRFAQRLLKRTKDEVNNNPDKVEAALKKADLGQLDIQKLEPGTFMEIRGLLDRGVYDVLVLDQLRNLRVTASTRVEELENAASEARNLAGRANVLLVAVTQAGGSADGKAVLGLMDVDGSKTGIPAQTDLMIGVGNTESMWANGLLTLSLPKNKLSGDHGSFQVQVNKATGVIH